MRSLCSGYSEQSSVVLCAACFGKSAFSVVLWSGEDGEFVALNVATGLVYTTCAAATFWLARWYPTRFASWPAVELNECRLRESPPYLIAAAVLGSTRCSHSAIHLWLNLVWLDSAGCCWILLGLQGRNANTDRTRR